MAGLLVAVRSAEPAAGEDPQPAVRTEATVVWPRLLSQAVVTGMARERAGGAVSEQLCAAATRHEFESHILRHTDPPSSCQSCRASQNRSERGH
jgi:hypothetical protein